MTAKRLLFKLHLWLSLPLGILVTLICLSGATLVFKSEIRNALGMPRVVAPHGTQGNHHAGKTAGMGKTHGKDQHKDNVDAPHKKNIDDAPHKKHDDAPYGTTTKRDFFSYVTKFHTGLMLGKTGKLIVTYTTLIFVFILVSGLWICWPRDTRQWRKRFSLERRKGSRRLLYDLHMSLGWWTVVWLLLLAVTGLGFGLKLVPKGTETMQLFHALHIGAWGGITTKVITFAVSLVGASLPVTGYWLYFRKRAN